MHRGFCLPAPRHARHATSVACNSGAASPAGETRRSGFNTPLAQWALHARVRNWVKGRIAECPRLQQKSSEPLITELAVIVSYSAPLRGVKPMVFPSDAATDAPYDPPRRSTKHVPKRVRDVDTGPQRAVLSIAV
jgi:hypothetical protein